MQNTNFNFKPTTYQPTYSILSYLDTKHKKRQSYYYTQFSVDSSNVPDFYQSSQHLKQSFLDLETSVNNVLEKSKLRRDILSQQAETPTVQLHNLYLTTTNESEK
ncbi:hypothetical protein SS50377_21920 [Spironucleus salmonicida]|uniref:Uncharacterized protein n=1 Tax=Spironucleus salmonicida TaxID=348837 RepID=A0A9P8LYL8_9EUKA|nr:hypothetical protein SS50377_21920 [Spironucleus salmonicida]